MQGATYKQNEWIALKVQFQCLLLPQSETAFTKHATLNGCCLWALGINVTNHIHPIHNCGIYI